MALLTSLHPTAIQERVTGIDRLTAENQRLQDELSRQQRQMQHLQAAFEEVVAAKQRLESQLAEAQAAMAQLLTENEQLTTDLNELKQAPFKSGRRSATTRTSPTSTGRGRHPGQGRRRPERIDQTERVEIGDSCPDCGTAFTGKIQVRSRVVEDIEPVRPTIVTRYEIERRWCPRCRTYQESPVTAALPRYRLGLHLMLFVVYQKVALGLSYGKIKRELETYFSLSVSRKTLQAQEIQKFRLS